MYGETRVSYRESEDGKFALEWRNRCLLESEVA